MPKDKASVYRSVFDAFQHAVTTRSFGINEMLALASGKRDAFLPILEAAKKALIHEATGKGA